MTVSFALNTSVGGIALAPASATSANDGTVQTVVSSGTAHTSVRVTASIASPALTTQSGILAVTTGLPASNAFSIAVSCPNVEAANIDGIVVPVTVRLADRYNNPAPDGTAIAFSTNGGHIGGNCTTPSSATSPGDGTCSVNWISAEPRPTPASTPPTLRTDRVTILATAIGEESFNDVNGNGYYDPGEPFTDLGEPYRDDNENNMYDVGEDFLDFNHNGQRDAPSGKFVGITCTGSTPGSTCSSSTLAIGAQAKIIMSSGSPDKVQPPSGTTLANSSKGGTNNYGFLFQDANLNPLPAGTTISAAVVGTGLTVNAPTSFTVPCTTNPTGYALAFGISHCGSRKPRHHGNEPRRERGGRPRHDVIVRGAGHVSFRGIAETRSSGRLRAAASFWVCFRPCSTSQTYSSSAQWARAKARSADSSRGCWVCPSRQRRGNRTAHRRRYRVHLRKGR